MKHYYLDLHSASCENATAQARKVDQSEFSLLNDYCDRNPKSFLFYLGGEFRILTYHSCMQYGNHLDFKVDIVRKIIKDNKIYKYYDVERGIKLATDLKEFRLRDAPLRKYIIEVNYIYQNAANVSYAITTSIKFEEILMIEKGMNEKYKEAKDILLKTGREYLLGRLDDLASANGYVSGGVCENYEVSKTIDHLINTINQSKL